MDPARNKANALAFYDLMFNQGQPAEAVRLYVGAAYVQHNPRVADGARAFIDYFEAAAKAFPGRRTVFRHILAEGDMVAIHSHQTWATREPAEWAVADFFRFDAEGKIVEHWGVLQGVPEVSANRNTMF